MSGWSWADVFDGAVELRLLLTPADKARILAAARAQGHFHTGGPSQIICNPVTITLTGTPAFSAYFSGVRGGYQSLAGLTFVGAATGPRFLVHRNGIIDTNGAGVNYFPGSVAGTADAVTGGLYV